MDSTLSLDELRRLFMSAPESDATRAIAIIGSLALAAVVLLLVRRGSLREEYTPIWLAVAGGLILISVRLDVLRAVTSAIGAWTPSSTLFFLGEIFLVAICLNFAVRLSRAGVALKNLGQEVALLRARLDEAAPERELGDPTLRDPALGDPELDGPRPPADAAG